MTFAPSSTAIAVARDVAKSFTRELAIDVIEPGGDWTSLEGFAGALAADADVAADANRRLAAREGARLPVIEPAGERHAYPAARLSIERTLSVNTTAAGGNASLVAAMD